MNHTDILETIAKRYESLYWSEEAKAGQAGSCDYLFDAAIFVAGDTPHTYCWRDLDYSDVSRSGWRASYHYNRILLLLCTEGKRRIREDAIYRERILGLIRYWVEKDYKNPNWWHNDIGMPNHLNAFGLLLRDVMPAELLAGVIALGARGSMKTRPEITSWTGTNLIWGVANTIRNALLTGDTELLSRAVARAAEEITTSRREGVREDGAFYMHGPRWYSGGYGGAFTVDISQFVYILAGTPYAIPEEKVRILLKHVLDGQRHMMHHGYFDYNGVGREIGRKNVLTVRGIRDAVDLLAGIEGLPRCEEIRQFSEENHLPNEHVDADHHHDTRYYPSISYLAHNDRGIHIGVKCLSPGQRDMEICNSEALLCYNMSYGGRTCYMRRGDEYYNIDPLFDYSRMPGTTAYIEEDEALYDHGRREWWNYEIPNNLTRGMTRGRCGLVTQHVTHDGITATVTWFTYQGSLVALGADIRHPGEEGKVLSTTIDQCHPVDPDVTDPAHVSNGGFTYHNLDASTHMIAEVLAREGSWRRNRLEETYERVTGEVFCVSVPVEGENAVYAYAVTRRGEDCPAQVLENSAECQAILTGEGTLMAAIHTSGTYHLAHREYIVSSPFCIIDRL